MAAGTSRAGRRQDGARRSGRPRPQRTRRLAIASTRPARGAARQRAQPPHPSAASSSEIAAASAKSESHSASPVAVAADVRRARRSSRGQRGAERLAQIVAAGRRVAAQQEVRRRRRSAPIDAPATPAPATDRRQSIAASSTRGNYNDRMLVDPVSRSGGARRVARRDGRFSACSSRRTTFRVLQAADPATAGCSPAPCSASSCGSSTCSRTPAARSCSSACS